jgi:hypothetical protein
MFSGPHLVRGKEAGKICVERTNPGRIFNTSRRRFSMCAGSFGIRRFVGGGLMGDKDKGRGLIDSYEGVGLVDLGYDAAITTDLELVRSEWMRATFRRLPEGHALRTILFTLFAYKKRAHYSLKHAPE